MVVFEPAITSVMMHAPRTAIPLAQLVFGCVLILVGGGFIIPPDLFGHVFKVLSDAGGPYVRAYLARMTNRPLDDTATSPARTEAQTDVSTEASTEASTRTAGAGSPERMAGPPYDDSGVHGIEPAPNAPDVSDEPDPMLVDPESGGFASDPRRGIVSLPGSRRVVRAGPESRAVAGLVADAKDKTMLGGVYDRWADG